MFVRMLKLPDDVRARIRPVVAPVRDPRRRAVSGRGEAADDRVVGPDHRGVLLRDRRHGRDVHQQRAVARAPRLRRARRCSHRSTSSTRTATTCRPATSAPCTSNRRPSRPGFEYHKDEAKTKETFDAHGWASVGDMGYLDADGYLYLTDRRTFMIVSGGVNIYPQEAENILITHPKVFDVAVFGIPDPEMGEKVHAVVQPTVWDDAGTRARTRAARALPRAASRTTSARRRSTSIPSCRVNPPASSTSASSATGTGATRRRASSDGARPPDRERPRRRHLRVRTRPRPPAHARRPITRGRSARDGVRRAAGLSRSRPCTRCGRAAPRSSWSASRARS